MNKELLQTSTPQETKETFTERLKAQDRNEFNLLVDLLNLLKHFRSLPESQTQASPLQPTAPKLIIHISGGVLQSCFSNADLDIDVIDDDNLEGEGVSRESIRNLFTAKTEGLTALWTNFVQADEVQP